MNKKIFYLIFGIILLFASSACSNLSDEPRKYTTKDGIVEFVFPSGWKVNDKNENFDLHVKSKDLTDVTGVFVYNRQDMSDDSTPQTIIDYQIEQLKEIRKNFEVLNESEEYEVNGNSYITVVYSGEMDGFVYAYRLTTISFQDSDIFAYIVQTTSKSEYLTLEPDLKGITDSAMLRQGS